MSRSLDLSILRIGSQVHGGQENLCSCDGQNSGMWVLFLSLDGLGRTEQYEPWCKVLENRYSLGVGRREACPDQGQWLLGEEGE